MTIKLEKLKSKKNMFLFKIKGADEVFANTIRRLILEEVPTLAVEDLEIKDNNTALFDEMLALRLGLIPIKTDLKSYEIKDKCKCEGAGCARCELKITLKSSKNGYLYAEEAVSTDPKCTFVEPKTIVVKLLPKQKIDVTMSAELGRGKVHAKWSPGWPIYKKEGVLKLGSVKDADSLVKNCPDGVFTLKAGKLVLNEEKMIESHLLDYYAELDEGIKLEYTDNIIFSLESWGQLSPKEILKESANILIEKVSEMESLL